MYPFCSAGILYTARPRGDITGTARFVDMRNRLCCEVDFGKVSGAQDRLLQRSDAMSGSLFSFISEPPKTAANGGPVSHAALSKSVMYPWVSGSKVVPVSLLRGDRACCQRPLWLQQRSASTSDTLISLISEPPKNAASGGLVSLCCPIFVPITQLLHRQCDGKRPKLVKVVLCMHHERYALL